MALPAISPPSSPLLGDGTGLSHSASAPLLQKDGPSRKQGSAAARRASQRAAFLERQKSHRSVEARKQVAQLQAKLTRDGWASDDVEFWGAKGREGFRTYLSNKYGSLIAGWRVLDADGNGRLSFGELCKACRKLGFHGNLQKLWGELDTNKKGFVSIMDIDPEVGHYVSTYKLALMHKYGDMLTAWKKGIDTNGTGRIEEKEIVASLKDLNLTELDPKKLFKMLITGPKGMGLSLAEFDPHAWNCYCSGDLKGLTMKANKDLLGDDVQTEDLPQEAQDRATKNGGLLDFRKVLRDEGHKERTAEMAKNKARVGISDVEGFRKALIVRCGSLLQAWRRSLDIDGNGKITFGEFCVALSRLGLFGDIKGLWKQLTGCEEGKGFFLFKAIDPETDQQLTELRKNIREKYGNMLLCWVKALDTKGSGLCSIDTFKRMCTEVGFTGDTKELFRIMQSSDRAFLTLKDFDIPAYRAMTRGDFRMISEPDNPIHGKKPLELGFDERQQMSYFHQVRLAMHTAQKEEYIKACRAEPEKFMIDSWEKFEELCERKYGSITAAWRQCLDQDANGRLTFNEFVSSLRKLGYAGDFKALWKHYDLDLSGHITMQEIAPKEHDMIEDFLKLLRNKYGDLDAAWRYGFNKDPHDSIDEQELLEACEVLGYEHDGKQLFKILQPLPGRLVLTIWDIDPECTRARQRGQVAYLAGPKSDGPKLGPRPAFGTTGLQQQDDARSAAGGKTGSVSGDVGRSAVQQVRHALRVAYGSTAAAWRTELDPQMQGSVCRSKFLIVMENHNVSGNMKRLWEDLTAGPNGEARGTATYRDIDPEGARALEHLRQKLLREHNGLLQAWDQCLDADALGRVDEAEFLNAVEALGESTKSGRKLFKLLCARPGQRSLVCEDLQALLIGVPSHEAPAVWAGPEFGSYESEGQLGPWPGFEASDAADENGGGAFALGSPSSPTSPAAMSGSMSSMKMMDPISPRDAVDQAVRTFHAQDFIIRSVESFKKMLRSKYGSIFSAWRRVLDADGNGILTQTDFAKACQNLGVKDVQRLWSELDVTKVNQIALKDIDPEVSELFAELSSMLREKYGSDMKEGWKCVFDPDNKLRCDIMGWKSGCVNLGFGKTRESVERLFKLLRPEPGRYYLTYEDLWVDRDRNLNQFRSSKAAARH